MNAHKLLGAALAAQLGLMAITWWPEGEGPPPRAVLPVAPDTIQAVRIESVSTRARQQPIELRRDGDGWVIAHQYDYPALSDKIDGLLERLDGLRVRRPVATQAVRHKQLNVDDERPTRRLVLTAGDQEHTLLLGAASGRRMNVRTGGEDEVYQVEGMGAWNVEDGATAYFDTTPLDIPREQLVELQVTNSHGTITLRKQDGTWRPEPLGEEEEPAPERIREFVLDTLSLTASEPADPSIRMDPPPITTRWTLEDGTSGSYEVHAIEDGALGIRFGDAPPFWVSSELTRQQLVDTHPDELRRPRDAPPEQETP